MPILKHLVPNESQFTLLFLAVVANIPQQRVALRAFVGGTYRVARKEVRVHTVKPPISPLGAYFFNYPWRGGGLLEGGAYWSGGAYFFNVLLSPTKYQKNTYGIQICTNIHATHILYTYI